MIVFRGRDVRFCLDRGAGQLWRGGLGQERIHLARKEWEVLQYIAERPGVIITKSELQDQIWGSENTSVAETSVSQAISKIRKAIGDQAKLSTVIETITGRGFRFIAEIESTGDGQVLPSAARTSESPLAPTPMSELSLHAEDHFTAHVGLDLADILNSIGEQRAHDRQWTSAIENFDRAIRLNPSYSVAFKNRGGAREAQGDLKGAIADYTEAIHLGLKDADMYKRRGVLRKATGDSLGAIADYTKAIELGLRGAALFLARGESREAQGDLAGAVADYTEASIAARINSWEEVESYRCRTRVREALGDLAGARDDEDSAKHFATCAYD